MKNDDPNDAQSFVFVACQPRSQNFCKQEINQHLPWLKFSFSRPGFLTWKVEQPLSERFDLPLTFARTFGWSIEGTKSTQLEEISLRLAKHFEAFDCKLVHLWDRGWQDANSEKPNPESESAKIQLAQVTADLPKPIGSTVNQLARTNQKVLDVVRLENDHWWFGWHIAGTLPQRWPGGIPKLTANAGLISRAHLKVTECLQWSGIHIKPNDVCVEIGAAPGGVCQKLLQLGATVVAVDPAELDPVVAGHQKLTHLRMRGREIPHKAIADAKWLFVDSNVAPQHTLDTVEELIQGERVNFRGLFLTLKLVDQKLTAQIPEYIQRVRSWGFGFVKTRQLAYGGQEICLVALKQKSMRRFQK